MPGTPDPGRSGLTALGLFFVVGLTMAVSVGGGVAVGVWLDRRLGGGGAIAAPVILGGIGGGGWLVYRQIAKEMKWKR